MTIYGLVKIGVEVFCLFFFIEFLFFISCCLHLNHNFKIYFQTSKMNPITQTRNLMKMNDRELEMGVAGTKNSWHQEYKVSATVPTSLSLYG
jgi:hypothetical protein